MYITYFKADKILKKDIFESGCRIVAYIFKIHFKNTVIELFKDLSSKHY